MFLRKAFATAVQVIGIFFLFCGISTFILGIAMHIDSSSPQSSSGLPISIFSLSFIIPGAIATLLAVRSKKDIELLQSICGIVTSYRRIKTTELAEQLHIAEAAAARLLAVAVEKGIIKGNFDRTTGEFFTEDSETEQRALRFCPSCGAPLERVFLKGETIRCRSCGGIVQ